MNAAVEKYNTLWYTFIQEGCRVPRLNRRSPTQGHVSRLSGNHDEQTGPGRVMKITAQEEFGLRCALQLAEAGTGSSLTLPEIASREGITTPHAGKLLAMLRQADLVRSVRGRTGGYSIARPADSITAAEVLRALGTRPWPDGHCDRHRGTHAACVHSQGCSVRSLWGSLDFIVDRLLGGVTLDDLLHGRLPGDERAGTGSEPIQTAVTAAGKGAS